MEKYILAIDQGTTSTRAIIFNHEQKAHGSLKTFAGQGIPGGGSRLKAAGNFPRIPENRSRCRLGFSGGIPLLVRKTVLIPVTMCAVISSACGNS